MKLRPTGFLGAVIGAALLAGCSSSECYENHSALPLATFYNGTTFQQVSLQRLAIYGIGAPGDSVLYQPQNLSQAYLPFRIWQDSTTYVLAYYGLMADGVEEDENVHVPTDTIVFRYKPKEWFVSPACGAMYFFEMDTVTHSSFLIDSIAYNDVITNQNATNIKIFFKTVISNN